MNKRESLLLNNQFMVAIGPLLYSFAKISNLTDSYELETMYQGGSNRYPELLTKQKSKAETLILERGVLKSPLGLADMALTTGVPVTAVTIMVLNHGRVHKAYFFEYGMITKWEVSGLDAVGKDILIKKIEITHNGLHEVPVP